MREQINKTWALLREQGIVQAEQPSYENVDSPWYVKVLLAFSGWLAAIFILGFIGLAFTFVFKDSAVAAIVGVFMIFGAFAMLRIAANEFVEHMGLAVSMVGQILLSYAILDISQDKAAAWLLITVVQGALVMLMPSFVHGVVSSFVAGIALSIAFSEMHIPYLIGGLIMLSTSFCWINEFRYPQHIKKIRAIGYGLVLALISLKATTLFSYRVFGEFSSSRYEFWAQPWLGEVLLGVATLYVAWSILQRYEQPLTSRLSITSLWATLVVCVLSVSIQGITVGIVIICLGQLCKNRVLLGLGISSLLFYISLYYYLLDKTLMDKSKSLFVIGLTLLFVRWLMLSVFPTHKEEPHV
jgi:hypothetical protein